MQTYPPKSDANKNFRIRSITAGPTGFEGNIEEENLNKAIEASLKQNTQMTYEPLDLEQRVRKEGEPVGLKNIGNTCYFNSLMQTLFRIEDFVREVVAVENLDKIEVSSQEDPPVQKRKKESVALVKNLQELFCGLTASSQKYIDPSAVLHHCVDEQGEQVKIGDQKDIIEYAINFFERIAEVLAMHSHSNTSVLLFHQENGRRENPLRAKAACCRDERRRKHGFGAAEDSEQSAGCWKATLHDQRGV